MEDSPAYFRRYWGKADPNCDGATKWHPFAYHSLDVAAVADAFWACSPSIRRAFRTAFAGVGDQALRAWTLFFVALHDIGKLHALFQIKASDALTEAWPDIDQGNIVKRPYDHGCDGFAQADDEIADWISSGRRTAINTFGDWLAAVAGHHGSICQRDPDRVIRGYAAAEIRRHDAEARRAWVEKSAELFLSPAGLTLADAPLPGTRGAIDLLAGFCSLCDWIGSNTAVFGYKPLTQTPEEYLTWATKHLASENALRRFGLTASPRPYSGVAALLKPDESPRGVQTLVERLPTVGTLTIVEAPTGSGKTEAALAYAWRLLDGGAAESIVFALPTQATANAMLARAQAFAKQAYGSANVVLAHGNRAFSAEFQQLVEAARTTTAQKNEEAGVQCAGWLASSRKRIFLGQIGVCTVDQVLLSVLPVRHSFVRGFGLNRSVLVVDEVHAYDAYMNGLLEEVLRRQKATGGSAVLLSATLPTSIRRDLLKAWECESPDQAPYPTLWTAHDEKAVPVALPASEAPAERTVEVNLSKLEGAFPDEILLGRIIEAARAGGLVGIVMNTVDHAQRLARLLRTQAGETPVDLFHARFRLRDRQEIERGVINRYGRDADRSAGRILVATQVIEQSLDLDFDWLVTQLCPVDLLFQRLGRLHRHERAYRPPGHERPACTVLAMKDEDYGLHKLIYGDPRLLWRTERLLGANTQIRFPDAYREWIEHVYNDDVWQRGSWDDEPEQISSDHYAWVQERKTARAEAKHLTTMTVSKFRDEDSRTTSLTRDGEMSLSVLPMLIGKCLLDGTSVQDLDERERAEVLLLNTVPAPASWEKCLSGCRANDEVYDGRYLLEMSGAEDCAWIEQDHRLRYSTAYGLEKMDEPA